jgi:hypothetical protein
MVENVEKNSTHKSLHHKILKIIRSCSLVRGRVVDSNVRHGNITQDSYLE